MSRVNPNAVFFVAFTTAVGAIFGHALIGLATGLGLCLVTACLPPAR